jgi:hypothetical protein
MPVSVGKIRAASKGNIFVTRALSSSTLDARTRPHLSRPGVVVV